MTRAEEAETCDVLIIGGGPAGSTAAALLAEEGYDVVLLEREAHPRFHIGESLLPRNQALFERLGIVDEVARLGVFKPGAEFVDEASGRSTAFAFADAADPRLTASYQVPRGAFDALLFDTARKRGARVAERTRVLSASPPLSGGRGRVEAEGPKGARCYAPRFLIDASGRDAFLAGRLGTRRDDRRNRTAAAYGHFAGVGTRGPARDGYITIHLVDDGWFWTIPLPGGITSVGFVAPQAAFKRRQGSVEALFATRVAAAPVLAARMQGAEPVGPIRATGNYSYRARRCWGEGWMMAGDAFAFLDPIFSSGVLLAMSGGERAAAVAVAWLADARAGRLAARAAERSLLAGMARFAWLIYRINHPVLRAMFLAPRNTLGMRDGLVSLLAGNLEPDRRGRLPVLAFKLIFHAGAILRRLLLRRPAPA